MQKIIKKNFQEELGRRIKAKRKEIGINAETLAETVGISKATQYRYEKGEICINADTLVRTAQTLNSDPNELLGWNSGEAI